MDCRGRRLSVRGEELMKQRALGSTLSKKERCVEPPAPHVRCILHNMMSNKALVYGQQLGGEKIAGDNKIRPMTKMIH